MADGLPRPSLVGYGPLFALIVGRLIILPACYLGLFIPVTDPWDERYIHLHLVSKKSPTGPTERTRNPVGSYSIFDG